MLLGAIVTSPTLSPRRLFVENLRLNLERACVWIDRHAWPSFMLLTLSYAIAVCLLSSMKLLWLDELITLHIARLGSARAIWDALAQGADPNPPMTHLLVMASRALFGEHEIALRLPALVGYWIGILCLFLFLRRRVSATWALAGAVMSMAMGAFEYSYESRSYGIFYGLAMLAVLCWSISADHGVSAATRRAALAGLVLALAGGISANYFAVLAFLPIAGGELTRTVSERHGRNWRAVINPSIWIGLLLAAMPLFAFRPLIQRSIAQFAPYAWNKVSLDQVADSYTEMVEIILFPLLGLMVFAGVVIMQGRSCAHCRAKMRPRWFGRLASRQAERYGAYILPVHEGVAVFLLMTYPILGYCVASIRGGMLSPRFVIPVCFGFAIAGTIVCVRIFGHIREAATVALLCCVAWFVAREAVIGYWYMEQKQAFYKVLAHMPGGDRSTEPIVIADPLMALTFQHYAPAAMAQRIVFPVDFPAIRLTRREDSPEENLWVGRNRWYNLPVVPLADFQRSAGRYLIVASDGNWLVQDLLRHRYPVQRLPISTRAAAVGGFTPLNHGTPVFYSSVGDKFFAQTGYKILPIPFKTDGNLPNAKLGSAEWGPFNDK
jgi:4-amino-4-deoxy-L-arabinose transferase-like glycosyltransferase